jgi:hypothetical protein
LSKNQKKSITFQKAEKIQKRRSDRRKTERSSKSRSFLLKAEEVATLFTNQMK